MIFGFNSIFFFPFLVSVRLNINIYRKIFLLYHVNKRKITKTLNNSKHSLQQHIHIQSILCIKMKKKYSDLCLMNTMQAILDIKKN